MKIISKLVKIILIVSSISSILAAIFDKKDSREKENAHKPKGLYEKHFKRPLDAFLAAGALIVLSPVLIVVALLVRIKLGSPVLFTQERPGKDEKVFKLYKFRTMTDERDENGELMPDEIRLTSFGKKLRATSLDELPELINILKGDMAIVGPRPQLVRDMVFMSDSQRKRHIVRPGMSGLAQVMGRNSISWEEKLSWDLKYLEHICFYEDARIVWLTLKKVFLDPNSMESTETDVTDDYGDALLKEGKIDQKMYDELQLKAKKILSMKNGK